MSEPANTPTNQPPAALATLDFGQVRQVDAFKCSSPLMSCRIDAAGKYAYAGAQDFSIQRFRLNDGACTSLVAHESWVRTIACHPNDGRVYSGGYDGQLVFWSADEAQPRPERTIGAHRGWIRSICLSPDGACLASAGNDGVVNLWDANDGRLLHRLAGHKKHVYTVAFHPHEKLVVSGDLQGNLIVWDQQHGEQVRHLDASTLWKYDPAWKVDVGGARSLFFDPAGGILACGGITDVTNPFAGIGFPLVLVFDWPTGQLRGRYTLKDIKHGAVSSVRSVAPGMLVASVWGASGGFLAFWQVESPVSVFELKLPELPLDLDVRSGKAITAHHDGTLRAWRLTGLAG